MNFESQETRCSHSEALSARQSALNRLGLVVSRAWTVIGAAILMVVCFSSPIGTHVLAKSVKQLSPQSSADVDPHAIEILTSMGAYLRTLQAFQVQATLSTDDVMDDGQAIQTSRNVELLAARPNRFRVEVTGDDISRLYLYDGKDFTIWARLVNYYATVPAPPTIPELIDKLTDRYDIDLPLVDLFRWGTNASDAKKITKAVDIGPSSVGGVTCEQYAFHQADIDWQIWIQLGHYPLPRKLVIRTLTNEAKPQHSEVLTWNLAPSFDDGAFVFDPPPDAHRIVIEDMKAQPTEKK